MKLELGKTYRMRNGNIVRDFIMKNDLWYSKEYDRHWWDGGRYLIHHESEYDLIEEVFEWWESLKIGDNVMIGVNVEVVTDVTTSKLRNEIIIHGEFSTNEARMCSPYIKP